MSSISPEKWHFLPVDPEVGSLIDPYGGRTVESYKEKEIGQAKMVEGSNEISWQEMTSRGDVIFALIQDGFRANFLDWGLGVKYDDKGELSAIRIEILTLLASLLNVADLNGDINEDLIDLEGLMGDCGEEFVAHLNLVSGEYAIYVYDSQNDENTVLTSGMRESYREPTMLLVTYKGFSFSLILGDSGEQFGVGIGVFEKIDNDISSVGSLSGETDESLLETSLLSMFLSKDCNYTTFLDNNRADRFDRLAQRIILD